MLRPNLALLIIALLSSPALAQDKHVRTYLPADFDALSPATIASLQGKKSDSMPPASAYAFDDAYIRASFEAMHQRFDELIGGLNLAIRPRFREMKALSQRLLSLYERQQGSHAERFVAAWQKTFQEARANGDSGTNDLARWIYASFHDQDKRDFDAMAAARRIEDARPKPPVPLLLPARSPLCIPTFGDLNELFWKTIERRVKETAGAPQPRVQAARVDEILARLQSRYERERSRDDSSRRRANLLMLFKYGYGLVRREGAPVSDALTRMWNGHLRIDARDPTLQAIKCDIAFDLLEGLLAEPEQRSAVEPSPAADPVAERPA